MGRGLARAGHRLPDPGRRRSSSSARQLAGDDGGAIPELLIMRFEREARAQPLRSTSSAHGAALRLRRSPRNGRLYYVMELLDGSRPRFPGSGSTGRSRRSGSSHLLRPGLRGASGPRPLRTVWCTATFKPGEMWWSGRAGTTFDFRQGARLRAGSSSTALEVRGKGRHQPQRRGQLERHAGLHGAGGGASAPTDHTDPPGRPVRAWACVAYWLLTGTMVFEGAKPHAGHDEARPGGAENGPSDRGRSAHPRLRSCGSRHGNAWRRTRPGGPAERGGREQPVGRGFRCPSVWTAERGREQWWGAANRPKGGDGAFPRRMCSCRRKGRELRIGPRVRAAGSPASAGNLTKLVNPRQIVTHAPQSA